VPLYPNEMAIVVRRGHPLAATRSLAALMDSEWITAGLGTASLVVDDMFAAAGLPTPRWAIRCESIPGADRDHGAIRSHRHGAQIVACAGHR